MSDLREAYDVPTEAVVIIRGPRKDVAALGIQAADLLHQEYGIKATIDQMPVHAPIRSYSREWQVVIADDLDSALEELRRREEP